MKLYCIIALSLLLRPETATAQQEESITLSLQQAIEIAQENSPEARRCVVIHDAPSFFSLTIKIDSFF